ncbi:hypothetical protein GQ457_13G017540 [Hibiscus cannabinus]
MFDLAIKITLEKNPSCRPTLLPPFLRRLACSGKKGVRFLHLFGKEFLNFALLFIRVDLVEILTQEGKEDQGITFVQVRFCGYGSIYKQWGGSALFWSMLDSFKLMRCLSVPEINTGIRVSVLVLGNEYRYPFRISLVSIHGKEYRYPSSLMELEYWYWLSSTGTGCL